MVAEVKEMTFYEHIKLVGIVDLVIHKIENSLVYLKTFNKIRSKYYPKDPQMSKIYCRIKKTS